MTQLPFFVYGTLLPGQPNAYLWGESIAQMEMAWFENGRLYDCGPYPMLIEETAVLPIHGQLITIHPDQYDAILTRIDTLEGYTPQQPDQATYQRVSRQVWVGHTHPHTQRRAWAWLYLGRADLTTHLPPIPSGNWVTYAVNRHRQMSNWWRTVSSVAGLHDQAEDD